MEQMLLAIFVVIVAFLAIEIIILHNKYNCMPSKQDFEDLKAGLSRDLENIKADVSGLKTKIVELEAKVKEITEKNGLSADDEQAIFDAFKAVKDEAATIAGETPDVEQPEEPETEEGEVG